jgi:sulfatase modifying factor 1
MASVFRIPVSVLVTICACGAVQSEPTSSAAPPKSKPKASSQPGTRTPAAGATKPSAKDAAKGREANKSKDARKSKDANKGQDTDKAAEGPSSCPDGMVLVEGEYCSDVEHECKKSWYDKSNKKTVCEEFAEVSRCKGTKEKKRFCIDRYTYPNEKGARPEVMNRFHQAEVKCAALGKRLCTESEWTLSCEGPRMLPFPYGYVRDTKKCHGDLDWDSPNMKKVAARDPEELARLWKGKRNGSQPECISEYGVADLPGNVDEVVASESYHLPGFKGKFDSIHTGGPWYKGVRNQCRPKIYTHDEGFYYYFLGFRCCAEPDGKPTDPRTPMQIEKKWSFERVEKSAGFTIEEMRDKLKLKEQNKCECAAKDILCKTMCGTLLAPSAKD